MYSPAKVTIDLAEYNELLKAKEPKPDDQEVIERIEKALTYAFGHMASARDWNQNPYQTLTKALAAYGIDMVRSEVSADREVKLHFKDKQ